MAGLYHAPAMPRTAPPGRCVEPRLWPRCVASRDSGRDTPGRVSSSCGVAVPVDDARLLPRRSSDPATATGFVLNTKSMNSPRGRSERSAPIRCRGARYRDLSMASRAAFSRTARKTACSPVPGGSTRLPAYSPRDECSHTCVSTKSYGYHRHFHALLTFIGQPPEGDDDV
jgi:hypothetical protein